MGPEMISVIKRKNCGKGPDIARNARDMHGGTRMALEDCPTVMEFRGRCHYDPMTE
jgi:hypothetical protein